MNKAIETGNLVKRFGDVTAVDGVSLSVAQGEIYAFLGLNGASEAATNHPWEAVGTEYTLTLEFVTTEGEILQTTATATVAD